MRPANERLKCLQGWGYLLLLILLLLRPHNILISGRTPHFKSSHSLISSRSFYYNHILLEPRDFITPRLPTTSSKTMDQDVFERDEFDLGGRSRIVPFVEDEEHPDDEKIRTQRNKQWTFLDGLSATLRENLRKNKVFERCTEFAACLLNNTRPDALAEKSLEAPSYIFPPRPDVSNEAEILQSRIFSARQSRMQLFLILMRIQVNILTHHGIHDLEKPVEKEEPRFFYRLTDAQRYTLHNPLFGFICGKWRSASGPFFSIPNKDDFKNHMSGQEETATPYISMTESPGRLWNLLKVVKSNWKRYETANIAIIDAAKLRQMGIDFARSTDIREGFGILGAKDTVATKDYTTKTSWLAQFWMHRRHG